MEDEKTLRERLEEEILEDTPWDALRLHAEKGVVLVVGDIELLDAAEALATDDTKQVSAWLNNAQLRRLETSDQEQYEEQKPTFHAIIVRPWVLVQRILN